MDTIKDVFCFLIELDFIKQINSDNIEKLRCVKQRLVIDIEDYNVSKLIYSLYFVDDMSFSIITIEIKDFLLEKSL